jgi:hypothetical protein
MATDRCQGPLPSLVLLATLFSVASARADSSWDGVWKGYWGQVKLTVITVKGGVVDYFNDERHFENHGVHIDGKTLSFDTRINHIVLTRTGENTADGVKTGTYDGRLHVGGLASGYGAGSYGGSFVRQ